MKPLIVANWKMNPSTIKEAKELFNKVKKTGAIICAPFTYLSELKSDNLCAQNCYWEASGPYTGEISLDMLKDLGVAYVIIGHSERRVHFKETDEMINKKLKAALATDLRPILCIGEKKGEDAKEVIKKQLEQDLNGISKKDLDRIIIAYEPVWAIGTGDFCEASKAKESLESIKEKLNNKVLYGGSVNSKISKDYIDVGFDGLLVGGASLKVDEFIKINQNV
ncbi:triose-phosphate isomerase [Patescibacteria group bacterium]|nr:triose-phosphate isomerase [Patescibacteria group bacterium]MBU4458458.1 triose-phosphate isomerase [Patescibacteria group bacterium]MCG2695988.1 triose-phosphate isomerase [Candidatus Portnoybacteria bacterium]